MLYGNCESARLMDIRELMGSDGKVWRTIAKLSFMGGSVEASTGETDSYIRKLVGKNVKFKGEFGSGYKGAMDFTLVEISEIK